MGPACDPSGEPEYETRFVFHGAGTTKPAAISTGVALQERRSYFFVRIVDQWRIIERSAGISGVVKFGATPAKCPDEEIAQLLARADPDGVIRLNRSPASSASRNFEPGAPVMIADGPFRGLGGVYAV